METLKNIPRHGLRQYTVNVYQQLVIFGILLILGDWSFITALESGSRPHFDDSTPKNVTVYPGETAKLRCSIQNLQTKTVIWRRKNDFHPLTIGDDTFVSDQRFRAVHPPGSTEWNLEIHPAKPIDAHIYECQVSTSPKMSRFIQLNIAERPIQPKPVVGGTEFVEKGSKVYLMCNASGTDPIDPPPEIEWFKDGNKINSNAENGIEITNQIRPGAKLRISMLEIDHSRMKDAGVYICRTSDKSLSTITVNVLNVDTWNVKRGTLQQDGSVQPAEPGQMLNVPDVDSSSVSNQKAAIILILITTIFGTMYTIH